MIGVELSQEQIKRLSKNDVEKYFKRYEASLSSKTCDAIVDTFLQLLQGFHDQEGVKYDCWWIVFEIWKVYSRSE